MVPYWASEQNVQVQKNLNRVPIFVREDAKDDLHHALMTESALQGIGYSDFIHSAIDSKFWEQNISVEMIERDLDRIDYGEKVS